MCLACKEQEGRGGRRSYSHKANNFHYEHVEANGERRRRAQWATIAMAAAAPVLLLLFSLSMSSSCAVCTPNARQQQERKERTTTMPFTQCLLSIVRCPFASWLFAYFYHRFGAVAATEIIDKVFNQPLTLTQRHNVYSVCVCVCVRGERFYRLPGITIIKRPPQSSETRQQFSVRWFVRSFARIMRDA